MAKISGTIGFEQFSLMMENCAAKYEHNDQFPIAGYSEVKLIDEAWSIALAVQDVLIKAGYKNPVNYVRIKQNSNGNFDINWGAGIDAYKKKVDFETYFEIKEKYNGWKVGNDYGI
jgi:hypothetical protein